MRRYQHEVEMATHTSGIPAPPNSEMPAATSEKPKAEVEIHAPSPRISKSSPEPARTLSSGRPRSQTIPQVLSEDLGYAIDELERLPKTESMCLGPIPYHEKLFIREVGYGHGEGFNPLSIAATTAMALTEIACSGGLGKVNSESFSNSSIH